MLEMAVEFKGDGWRGSSSAAIASVTAGRSGEGTSG